jgi:two-component system sensor histidine kinase TctE
VLLEPHGDRYLLSVIDNGRGLTSEERQRLMRRGVRGTTSDKLGQGAGLGLSIVTRFAQVMHVKFELGNAPQGSGLRATLDFQSMPLPRSP